MAGSGEKWDRFKIKAEVQRRGKTLTEVAIDAGLSESACRVALHGNSRAGAEALSAFLNVPVADLFPGFYLRTRSNRGKPTSRSAGKSRQNRVVGADNARASF